MSRHIDADRASLNLEINFTEEEKEQKKLSIIDLITYIGEQPTVDAVEVVRCKDKGFYIHYKCYLNELRPDQWGQLRFNGKKVEE